jgi:hypothetical protein
MKKERRTEVGAELKSKEKDLKNWGDYAKACRQFAESIKGLPGLRAFASCLCWMTITPTIGTGWLLSLFTLRFIGSTLPSLTRACIPVTTGTETVQGLPIWDEYY